MHILFLHIALQIENNVQATDDSCASVAHLSSWLAANPTSSTSRCGGIRKGTNVVSKSRKFEQVKMNGLAKSRDIEVGTVRSKQAWLEGAFGGGHNTDEDSDLERLEASKIVSARKRKAFFSSVHGHDIGGTKVSTNDLAAPLID